MKFSNFILFMACRFVPGFQERCLHQAIESLDQVLSDVDRIMIQVEKEEPLLEGMRSAEANDALKRLTNSKKQILQNRTEALNIRARALACLEILQSQPTKTPKFGTFLLWLILDRKMRDAFLGDLEEDYRRAYKELGSAEAWLYFYKQVLLSAWPLIKKAVLMFRKGAVITGICSVINWLLKHWQDLWR